MLPGRDEWRWGRGRRSKRALASARWSGPWSKIKGGSVTKPGLMASLELTRREGGQSQPTQPLPPDKRTNKQKQPTFLCHSLLFDSPNDSTRIHVFTEFNPTCSNGSKVPFVTYGWYVIPPESSVSVSSRFCSAPTEAASVPHEWHMSMNH